ncbi:hypothetical protein AZI85_16060 [Bdellovibrio bacteriovorus]|uniref:TauD/TfdA-like domain-containing protein n=1 Tax=Bdellovibrio bacteriovorus TaxID=959 RepID=A0A150WTR1_BDEBC|nr:TauD/TfdA family dioxygenase [Bdellovibrio bacteriovorus]KYG69907.1 hypothetical protein AZI85_16060 [Bdellovibrio bacteriovorus]
MLWEKKFTKDSAAETCKALVEDWKNDNLKVFVLRAAEKIESVREFYETLFPFIGTPAALAEDVNVGDRSKQRTGKVWMEVRFDPRFPDAYRHSANAQPLHTDGSYIPTFPNSTLLACVTNAGSGGETTFLDSVDLVECMKSENPVLLEKLMSRPVSHSRSGDSRSECIICQKGAKLHVNWNYYCVSSEIGAETRNMVEEFHSYLLSSSAIKAKTLAVKLQPGDSVMWKDDELLHGRNSFAATKESERFIWKCAMNVGVF